MNKVLNAIGSLVCLILCVILFLVMCIYLFFNLTPKIVNKDNVTTLVSSLDIKEILGDEWPSIVDALYEVADDNNIDRNVIDGLLNSKEIKEVLGSHFGNLVHAFLYNGEPKNITSEQLVGAVEQVIDRNASDLGYSLTIQEKAIVLEAVEEKTIELVDVIPTYEDFTKDLTAKDKETTHFVFGGGLKNILLIILIIIVVIIIICRWSIYRFAIWTGVTTSIVGGFFAAAGEVLNSMFLPELIKIYGVGIIELIQTNIFEVITNTGLIVLIVGVLQVVYYYIMKKTRTN